VLLGLGYTLSDSPIDNTQLTRFVTTTSFILDSRRKHDHLSGRPLHSRASRPSSNFGDKLMMVCYNMRSNETPTAKPMIRIIKSLQRENNPHVKKKRKKTFRQVVSENPCLHAIHSSAPPETSIPRSGLRIPRPSPFMRQGAPPMFTVFIPPPPHASRR
jgi:hypothetical protein